MNRGDQQSADPPDGQKPDGIFSPRPETQNNAAKEAESKLLEASLRGDIKAFADLFEHYRLGLYALCLRRLGDPSLAEDVVQDVFIKAFRKLPDSDHHKPMWPWLSTIAQRMCIDLQRRRSITRYSGDIDAALYAGGNGISEMETDSALDAVIASEGRAELWESLKVLPKRQRRVFLLYALDGWSCAEIAAAEGISVGAVYLLLFRARRKMRAARQSSAPAIVFPLAWFRWKLQGMEERIRMLLGAFSERFGATGGLAVSMGMLAVLAVTANRLADPSARTFAMPHNETSDQATQTQIMQQPSSQANLGTLPEPKKSPPTVNDPVGSLAEDLFSPHQDATPENSIVQSFTLSPNYENDHTIMALGNHNYDSNKVFYKVLFVSRDGGATWETRPSLLLFGHSLVLPPRYPEDRRIFAVGDLSVQQSDDFGAIFKTVSPWGGRSGAISPLFGNGDSRVLISGRNVIEYDADLGVTRPALLAIPPPFLGSTYPAIAFSPGYFSDSTVFVSDAGILHRCTGLFCEQVEIPTQGVPRLRFGSRCNQDGLAYAFASYTVLVSHDGARTLEYVPFPINYQSDNIGSRYIQDMAVLCSPSSDPAIFVSAFDFSFMSQRTPPGIYRSFDAGSSWTRASINLPGFDGAAFKLIATPTGRLIASGLYNGIACSEDLGATWARRCTPER